jgi:hypothetical protein
MVANQSSLCPMNASKPITGGAVIPVGPADVNGIPEIAFAIPDFEGSAIMRVFSNTTQTQIGCFQAVMRNGASFSHPAAVGSTLGVFTFFALLASFFAAIYGVSVPHMRTHYAHSLSVLVIFEVFHSIFFSGALSLNWPSVLAAFWSNFAWSAGMIHMPSIGRSINNFVGVKGNSSQVGGAGSTILNNNGGLQQQIYGRGLLTEEDHARYAREVANSIFKRATNETMNGKQYEWAGYPVPAGLPIPGNWSGFAGELSMVDIPAADAFLTGLIWLLILIAILTGAVIAFKFMLEAFSAIRFIKKDRFALFRSHWLGFTGLVVLRTMLIAFFMIMTLTLFQFSYGGKAGVIAIAVVTFIIFFAGIFGLAIYACFYRVRFGSYQSSPERVHVQPRKIMKLIPWYRTVRERNLEDGAASRSKGTFNFFKVEFVNTDAEQNSIHDNPEYVKRFGWLSARFRRTRWWFFAFWVIYQFVRACFVGGARATPTVQVIGLFVWEFICFVIIICINPFEGRRNTALAVWMLGISKVATAGLSIAFLPQFNLARIPTTIIGVIIIVIQGFLVVGVLILIVLGTISTYMTITRNREQIRPHGLNGIRDKYFTHLEKTEKDLPPPPPPVPEEPKEPYFSVGGVRRAPKIEDEDTDDLADLQEMGAAANPEASTNSFNPGNRASRANSMANSTRSRNSNYGSVPYGARVHRASWSSRDFQNWQDQNEINRSASPYVRHDTPLHATPSRINSGHNSANNSISLPRGSMIRPSPSQDMQPPASPTRDYTMRGGY